MVEGVGGSDGVVVYIYIYRGDGTVHRCGALTDPPSECFWIDGVDR
jgi:hypothetical protein